MESIKRRNRRLFLKSFFITALLLGCVIALIIGIAKGDSLMRSEITGKDVKIIEITDDAVKILDGVVYEKTK